jgi:hypothetical protein
VFAVKSGFDSQSTPAGEEQSSKVFRQREGENPPKSKVAPPFGMDALRLLLNVFSLFQLEPMDGSPTLSAMPFGDT